MYAVFGDSYISWLNRFNKGGLHNFHGRCKLYGVSGMTTTRKFEPEFQKMLNDRPRYCVFILFISIYMYIPDCCIVFCRLIPHHVMLHEKKHPRDLRNEYIICDIIIINFLNVYNRFISGMFS